MKPAAVVFDIDTVLANFYKGFDALAKDLGKAPVPSCNYWRWDARYEHDVWVRIDQSYSFWEDLEPLCSYRDAERIVALQDNSKGLIIPYFVTGRTLGRDLYDQTFNWLQDTLGVEHPQLIISAAKGDTCVGIHASHCIDDKPGNAIYTHYVTKGKTKSFILDNPGNRWDPSVLGSGVKRVSEVSEYLNAISLDYGVAV